MIEFLTKTFKYSVLHMYYIGDYYANCKNKEIWKQHCFSFAAALFEREKAKNRPGSDF